ncbi:peptidyl-prolyl cis-trans isomerase [Vibrio sp. HA2012]|uniref:peptidylprolyl isomerase n=1 Tax=Vibrio sp. HA2012 TaxID=1971595 RepID=UPI000C2C2D17|nr:peptidylprolyl isomerase [Vibrio sp. HA2012]PJC86069.1 peptidyl-prolyl cis-trans isomerase [Vibrio sp. HA2012]
MSGIKTFLLTLACLSTYVSAAPVVIFDTTLGQFAVDLDSEKAPVTTANFLKYVNDGSYEGTIFHRVIPKFMAQGGGFNTDMEQRPSYAPIVNEAANGLPNNTATIAMARTNVPDSATRQFFINYADNDFLNYTRSNAGYAVFGKVIRGFNVVQEMATKPTHSQGHYRDVPVVPIVIQKVYLQK